MDISKLAVFEEIRDFFMAGKETYTPKFKFRIAVKDYDVVTLTEKSVDIVRDYGNNVGDYIVVKAVMSLGLFYKHVRPFRNNLEGIFYKDTGDAILEYRYKAVVLNADTTAQAGMADLLSADELDTMGMVTVEFQLIDMYLEIIRGIRISRNMIDATVKSAISVAMGKKLEEVKVEDKPYMEVFDLVEPDNKRTYKHILIPNGTPLIDVPAYLQANYGVYNADIGTYFQRYNGKNTCFVYPLFNTKRFDESAGIRKLVVVVLPTTLYELNESTYKLDGDTLTIVVGESTLVLDDGEKGMMNQGVGVTVPAADPIIRKPVEVKEEGPKAKRASLNTEVIDREREDGMNIVEPGKPSDNQLKHFSSISRRLGNLVKMDWRYSDPDLLYPNMPVKILYDSGQTVKELKGTLQASHAFFTPGFPITTSLAVFVAKKRKEDEEQ